MLVLSIYAITDQRNRPAGPVGSAFAFCLMIMALGMAFGMNTGYAVDPARDFGPRLFTFCAGWGSKVFTTRHYYFWIPIVADLLGGVAGAGLARLILYFVFGAVGVAETRSAVIVLCTCSRQSTDERSAEADAHDELAHVKLAYGAAIDEGGLKLLLLRYAALVTMVYIQWADAFAACRCHVANAMWLYV
ncbi:unnamed protein product [Phytophthora lilii]|uniref:Unnamed protein product n=1 Tax=Phytophthora lilii TaxID=2077276 RepID=A0A9W6XXT4_9STRA|nr:unnamed protein product [Phytophthora lilii]